MFKRILSRHSSLENKRLFSNFLSLSVLHGLNNVIGLLTVPYIIRVIGPEKYGLLAFASAYTAYFMILSDYGFNLTATRDISINRDNSEKITEIFSSVMTIRFVLMIIGFLILLVSIFIIEILNKNSYIYILTYGSVIGQFLFPIWFFQGIERMKIITYLNTGPKIFFTILIFIFVKEQNDFFLVPLFNSLGGITAGILSLFLIKYHFNITFRSQNINSIIFQLKDGFHVFASNISISFFSTTNIVILGFIVNNTSAGYFAAAEKIMRALAMLQVPLVGALYPAMAKKLHVDLKKTLIQLKKIAIIGGFIYLVLLSVIFLFSDLLIDILFGVKMHESSILLKIICFVPLFIFINNIYGTQILLNLNRQKDYLKVVTYGGLINVILCTILTYNFQHYGTSISLFLTEFYIMTGMFFYAKKCMKDVL